MQQDTFNAPRILQVESDETSINYRYYDGARYLPQDIRIYSLEYGEQDLELSAHGYTLPPVKKGDTLILSPFGEKEYIPIADFQDYVFRKKRYYITEICQLLGASSYEFSVELSEIKKRSWDSETNGQYKTVEARLDIRKKIEETLKKKYELTETFKGKSPSMDDYERAKAHAEQYNLLQDNDVEHLLNVCNPHISNKFLHQTVKFSMSQETNTSLDIAFNLNVLQGVFKLSSEFHEATEYSKVVMGEIVIDFPE